jgi:hypothetical protein
MSTKSPALMACAFAVSAMAALALAPPSFAFDGWHVENVTMLPSKSAGYDYIAYDPGTKHVFLGHRKEGLQVFDPVAHELIKTMPGSEEHSSNGVTLIPEMDRGVINNVEFRFLDFIVWKVFEMVC